MAETSSAGRFQFSVEKAYTVTGGAGQPPALGPPAVSVHDDGHMAGQVFKIYLWPLLLF